MKKVLLIVLQLTFSSIICGQNKLILIVPCHRVIKTNGSLGGFTSIGGIKLKKKLLKFEKNYLMKS